jgi:hypothetical protein
MAVVRTQVRHCQPEPSVFIAGFHRRFEPAVSIDGFHRAGPHDHCVASYTTLALKTFQHFPKETVRHPMLMSV